MVKVLIAEGCREVDSPSGLRHYARGGAKGYARGGLFEMEHPGDVAAAVKIGGYVVPPGTPAPAGCGYRCPACGHGSYFRTCGRCGHEGCERE